MASKPLRQQIERPGGPGHSVPGLSDGVRIGGWLFFGAIRGNDPITRQYIADNEQQARNCFENLRILLNAAGAGFEHVARVTLYLADLKYREGFQKVWLEVFPKNPPARSAMVIADANVRPGDGCQFLIDVIAIDPAAVT
jgi:2-iminobutanoate/2-iminopropanoate deaminase